jgi:hypothetical protein
MAATANRFGGNSFYLRAGFAVFCGSVLTFFACQIFIANKMSMPLRIGAVIAIAAIGIAGIVSLLTPDEEDGPPPEKLYTADEVAALLAAVQSGKLIPAAKPVCHYCGKDDPEGTGANGSHYHRACLQTALLRSSRK